MDYVFGLARNEVLLKKGAYILSLTDRFAGCRGPVLVAMRSPKSGFFRSWAVVLRSYRLTRARDCRLSS